MIRRIGTILFTAFYFVMTTPAQPSPDEHSLPIEVPGNHPLLQLTGRFRTTPDSTLLFAWSGSSITMRFNGTDVDARLRDFSTRKDVKTEGNYFSVLLDDNPPVILKLEPGCSTYRLTENLSPGDHTITLFKQTEPSVGKVEFLGFTLRSGTILDPPEPSDRRIEFYGDSITCGFGNEGANETELFKPSTENNYLSYGQLTARNLHAAAHIVAWSGEGILRNSQGEVVHPIPTLYDQILPTSEEFLWNFAAWVPQVIVINLGTNDFLTGIPDREKFIETYLSLLEILYGHYTRPDIFCCLGPLLTDADLPGESKLTSARDYLNEILLRAENKGMTTIHLVEFDSLEPRERGSLWHPNLIAHQRMAQTLTDSIKQVTGW